MLSLTTTHCILIVGILILAFVVFFTRRKNIVSFEQFAEAVKGEKKQNVFISIFSTIFNTIGYVFKTIFSFIFSFQLYYTIIILLTSTSIIYFISLHTKITEKTFKCKIENTKWIDGNSSTDEEDMSNVDNFEFVLKLKNDSVFTYDATMQEYKTYKKGDTYYYVESIYPQYYYIAMTVMIIFCVILVVSTGYYINKHS
jgi:hypothetical protein